ncbi:transposable element Tc1 transposase [Trichonephila clavipes]|nr:transposable element Tc1 transposase [Trichonephila clavipes]
MKTVTYRPQANLTERVNRNLVQMIACFVEEIHENWDRFLHEFAFALRTSVNETTNKTPAELFLGRKIITPFSKLINVVKGAEYVGRNIEKLFDEARQNMRKQHKHWEKYYNRKRREVNIKVNDLVLVQTFISATGRRVVGKFMPKFEGPYRVLEEYFGKRNMPRKRARRHFSHLSEFERDLIIGMKTAYWSSRHVAGQVDCSECAIRNCWEQWTREGTHARKTVSRVTRKITRREDRRIVQQALVDPTVTPSMIRADVVVAIVPQTISRYLAEANLKSKHPFRALPLTPEHRQLRLQRCQARSMWNVTDWQKVVFSDEYRFDLAYDSRSILIVRRRTVTGQRYVDDILRSHVGPFLNGFPGAIFQQDNAHPHTARVAEDFLHHFQTLPWPARSPDLSPEEHVWDQLKRQMPSCHSVHDLEVAVQDLRAHLPQDIIRCLIN